MTCENRKKRDNERLQLKTYPLFRYSFPLHFLASAGTTYPPGPLFLWCVWLFSACVVFDNTLLNYSPPPPCTVVASFLLLSKCGRPFRLCLFLGVVNECLVFNRLLAIPTSSSTSRLFLTLPPSLPPSLPSYCSTFYSLSCPLFSPSFSFSFPLLSGGEQGKWEMEASVMLSMICARHQQLTCYFVCPNK